MNYSADASASQSLALPPNSRAWNRKGLEKLNLTHDWLSLVSFIWFAYFATFDCSRKCLIDNTYINVQLSGWSRSTLYLSSAFAETRRKPWDKPQNSGKTFHNALLFSLFTWHNCCTTSWFLGLLSPYSTFVLLSTSRCKGDPHERMPIAGKFHVSSSVLHDSLAFSCHIQWDEHRSQNPLSA